MGASQIYFVIQVHHNVQFGVGIRFKDGRFVATDQAHEGFGNDQGEEEVKDEDTEVIQSDQPDDDDAANRRNELRVGR